MSSLGRLLTAMITPFDEEGNIDYPQARKLAKGLVESGTDGLVIGGTTGEAPSMSDDEKIRPPSIQLSRKHGGSLTQTVLNVLRNLS